MDDISKEALFEMMIQENNKLLAKIINKKKTRLINAVIAQLVERFTCNEDAEGSNPSYSTTFAVLHSI